MFRKDGDVGGGQGGIRHNPERQHVLGCTRRVGKDKRRGVGVERKKGQECGTQELETGK